MEKSKLTSKIEITPFALGGNVFGWTADEATSFKILDAFIDNGGDFIDTADVYSRWVPGNSGGESETIIGKWLKKSGKRDRVIIATKVGSEMSPTKKGLSRSYIKQAVEDSLRRLQTDYIDLYQSHRDDLQTPIEETLQTYAELIKQGKIRAIGASNYTVTRFSQALAISKEHNLPQYETLQPLYNLYDRADYEQNLAELCQKEKISVIPYYGLASGFLTGKYHRGQKLPETARAASVQQKYMNDRGFRIIDALDQVARQYQATPAQIALAWLLTRPAIIAPIASATSVEQTQELLKTLNIKLDQAAIDQLNEASAY